MSEELSLYRAVAACRQGINLGLHPSVAALTAAETYRVSPGVVADLAHRAEVACQAARDALLLTSSRVLSLWILTRQAWPWVSSRDSLEKVPAT